MNSCLLSLADLKAKLSVISSSLLNIYLFSNGLVFTYQLQQSIAAAVRILSNSHLPELP